MKNYQCFMIMGTMCFVGSLLTNHLWNSLLLLIMMIYWYGGTIVSMMQEKTLNFFERSIEDRRFDLIVHLLSEIRGKK